MIATAAKIDAAEAEGFAAYFEDRPRAPWASQVIRDLVGNAQVGEGAAEIFAAFTKGWERATDEECARILADD